MGQAANPGFHAEGRAHAFQLKPLGQQDLPGRGLREACGVSAIPRSQRTALWCPQHPACATLGQAWRELFIVDQTLGGSVI